MAGGNATTTGIQFEAEVAAWFAAHLLTDTIPAALDLPSGVLFTHLELESDSPVDDIVAKTTDGGFIFVNVKTSASLTSAPNSPLGSAIDQFIRQLLSSKKNLGTPEWSRTLDPNRDRLVFVFTRDNTKSLTEAAKTVLKRISDNGTLQKEKVAKTTKEKHFFEKVNTLIEERWGILTGDSPNNDEVLELLKLVRFIPLDLKGIDLDHAKQLLTGILKNIEDKNHAWETLTASCTDFAAQRSGADTSTFRQHLQKTGIELKTSPQYNSDVYLLKQNTDQTLKDLQRLALLPLPDEGSERIAIDRQCTHVIADKAKEESFLLIGDPGAGKSGSLYHAATALKKAGIPVVAIAVDQHPANSLSDLTTSLRLKHPIIEVLSQWSGARDGVLFIDALDASRGGPSEKTYQELIRKVQELPNWHVVASIRIFDLRFGQSFRDIFNGNLKLEQFQEPSFPNVRHVFIDKLNPEELKQVWDQSPILDQAKSGSTKELSDLLRSPFNLLLLSNILDGKKEDTSSITAPLDLLNVYWGRRVHGDDKQFLSRERVLRDCVEYMINNRTFAVPISQISPEHIEHLQQLLDANVLVQWDKDSGSINSIAISHHKLFDYTIARLIFESGNSSDFAKRLTASDDHALLLAPAAIMAMQMLWAQTEDRSHFWQVAFAIAKSEGIGSFCKVLPARVAAESTNSINDAVPLIHALGAQSGNNHDAAMFIMRHCFGALLAGLVDLEKVVQDLNSPWPTIARNVAEVSLPESSWPLKAVVSQWSENIDQVHDNHKLEINTLARLLVSAGLDYGRDEGAVLTGIQGIANTMDTDIKESVAVLSRILQPERVSQFGHKDLFWLAQMHDRLLTFAPALLKSVYLAAFCTELPSQDEPTPMTQSRILPLISNKKQDFEGARYNLSRRYEKFVEIEPVIATQTLAAIVDYFITTEKSGRDSKPIQFNIEGIDTAFVPDGCWAWWDLKESYSRESKSAVGLLRKYVHALGSNAEINDKKKQIVKEIANSAGWASLWVALLQISIEDPTIWGSTILPLLTTPSILETSEAKFPAGEAIKKIHPLAEPKNKTAIEKAILQIESSRSQGMLLSCLDEVNITLTEARTALQELSTDGPLPTNVPPMTFDVGWSSSEDWWIEEEGIDLEDRDNAQIYNAAKKLAKEPESNSNSELMDIYASQWEGIQELYAAVRGKGIHEQLALYAWDKLSSRMDSIAMLCENKEHLDMFQKLEDCLLYIIENVDYPSSEHDEKAEANFAQSPSWGFAPRASAAGGLISIVRAQGVLSPQVERVITSLIKDGSPVVRHHILSRINVLCKAAPDYMWRVCEEAFRNEKNKGVLDFFLAACRRIIHLNPEWFSEKLAELDRNGFGSIDEESSSNDVITELILRLWVVFKQNDAHIRVETWKEDPVKYFGRVSHAIHFLRSALAQGDAHKPDSDDDRIRQEAIAFYLSIIKTCAPLFNSVAFEKKLNKEEENVAKKAISLLDKATINISFAVEARAAKKGAEGKGLEKATKSRFFSEMWPCFELLATVQYPSVTHNLLETLEYLIPEDPQAIFKLLVKCITEGGNAGGYQLESLGAELFVRTIQLYLADYRHIFEDPECRKGLVHSLDLFVDAGWPEARKLVYDLPGILR